MPVFYRFVLPFFVLQYQPLRAPILDRQQTGKLLCYKWHSVTVLSQVQTLHSTFSTQVRFLPLVSESALPYHFVSNFEVQNRIRIAQ